MARPVLLLLLALMIPVSGGAARADAVVPPGFVTRSATQLMLNGRPYRFAGVNIYNANSDGWCGHEMRSPGRLASLLDVLHPGSNAFRAWFFQPLSLNADRTARDWSAFDNTLTEARLRGLKVIVTLSNHWGECGNKVGTAVKSPDWYRFGYTYVEPGHLTSYRDYVAEVVTRYLDDPTILMWQLMNEAETKDLVTGNCEPGGHLVLRDFAADVAGLIKTIDPNHLVSLGTMGGKQCGQHRDFYSDVHNVATIDVCEFHDYNPTEAMPTIVYADGYDNSLGTRIDICHALGKPIFVGESGIPRSFGLDARATQFRAKVQAQFGAGVVGFLAWVFADSPLDATYDIRPGDPALQELHAPPLVTINLPAVGAVFERGQAAIPDYACADLSGTPIPCDAPVSADGLLDTWFAGPHAFTVSATDDFASVTSITHNYAVLPGNPRLTGAEFQAADIYSFENGVVTVEADCREDGLSTVSYLATGPVGQSWRPGPFPGGTFTETGTFTVGPEYALAGEGVAYGDLETFRATFRIDSPTGQAVGTKSLLIPGYHGGICNTPSAGSPFSGANLRMVGALSYDATIFNTEGVSRDSGTSSSFLGFGCASRCDDTFESRFITDGSPTEIDADADGVDDRIGTGGGAFDDGAGTAGSIVDAADNVVLVLSDPDGVRITVSGGTADATFLICGFELQVATGSDLVVTCGSITVEILAGVAQVLLGNGITVISVTEGGEARISENEDGSFAVENLGSVQFTVTVDGVTTSLAGGATLERVTTWDFQGFAAPVDNPPVMNVVVAGQTVPLQWRLLDADGAPVTDLTAVSVNVEGLSCTAGSALDLLSETATGKSGLQNLGDGYYQFNWKSPKSYAGSCKRLHLDLDEGITRTALFQLKK